MRAGKLIRDTINENKKIEKQFSSIATNELAGGPGFMRDRNRRGLQVYTVSQMLGITGRDEEGRLITKGVERPYFFLSISQRVEIFKLCSPVFGVVSSRMNRISGLNFNIVPKRKVEDKISDDMKNLRMYYNELKGSSQLDHIIIKGKIVSELKKNLPDLFVDLSNFDGCLVRWKKKIQNYRTDQGNEIHDWLQEPTAGVTWSEYIKKYVFDLMIHGASAVYKQRENGRLENFDLLPGGTVHAMKNPYFSAYEGYIQVVPGFEYQVYGPDEMSYSRYYPSSSQSDSFIPIEALINKVAESMLFDRMMADQADGTKPPNKLVIITNPNPFGDIDKETDNIPLDLDEQARVEKKINEPVKYGVMTFSGSKVDVVDLSRDSTLDIQNSRQKDIREEVALVFNMSNVEINLTGSGDTSGRATSESQQEIDQGKGVMPILKLIEERHSRDIIPDRFGSGYIMEFKKSQNEKEERTMDSIKLNNGELTVNEIREKYNKSTFQGDQYNVPRGTSGQGIPGQDELNPLFMKGIDNA